MSDAYAGIRALYGGDWEDIKQIPKEQRDAFWDEVSYTACPISFLFNPF